MAQRKTGFARRRLPSPLSPGSITLPCDTQHEPYSTLRLGCPAVPVPHRHWSPLARATLVTFLLLAIFPGAIAQPVTPHSQDNVSVGQGAPQEAITSSADARCVGLVGAWRATTASNARAALRSWSSTPCRPT
jgi:hypothetical protein